MEKSTLVLAHDLLLAHPELLGDTPPAIVADYQLIIAERTINILAHLTENDNPATRARANQVLCAIAHAPAGIAIEKIDWELLQQHYVLATFNPVLLAQARVNRVTVVELQFPAPFTYSGIRHLLVPRALCAEFALSGALPATVLQHSFADFPSLIPNEYLIFYPIEGSAELVSPFDERVRHPSFQREDYLSRIARYDAETDRLIKLRHLDIHDLGLPLNNPALAAYYDALNDPQISAIVTTGPAGTGKTYNATIYAREACIAGQFMHTYVLTEGRPPLGAVKGGIEEKMAPMTEFARDALRSYEYQSSKMRKKRSQEAKTGFSADTEGKASSAYDQIFGTVDLQWKRNFTSVPYEYARSRTFDGMFVILDEAQHTSIEQVETLITRPGRDSKLIIAGDMAQYQGSEAARHYCGLPYAARLLRGAEHAAAIQLNIVLRSDTAATVVRNRIAARLELGLPL